MNPINDQIPTKNLTDVRKPLGFDKSSELSDISPESLQNSKLTQNVDASDHQEIEENDIVEVNQSEKSNVDIQENEESKTEPLNMNINAINEKNSESKVTENVEPEEPDPENDPQNSSKESIENPKEQSDALSDHKDISEEMAEDPKQQPDVENEQKDINEESMKNPKQQPDVENVQKDTSEEIAENPKEQPTDENDAKDISEVIVKNPKQQPDVENDQKDISEEIVKNRKQPDDEDQKDISEAILKNRKQPDDEDQKDISEEIVKNRKQPDDEDQKDISEAIVKNHKQPDDKNYQKDVGEEIVENPKQPHVGNDQKDISEEIAGNSKQQPNNQIAFKENSAAKEDANDKNVLTEEEPEDVEDVEMPEDEEVDEIIVPDEAEAEDLTDEKDNEDTIRKSFHEDVEDEEEGSTKGSEIEDSHEVYEEENSKSSETVEKDEDSDKNSLNIDAKEDTSSKDCEESDIENNQQELLALEEGIKNTESPLEEPKSNEPNIDEDTTSQATYDPLNCTDKEQDTEDNAADTEMGKNENSLETQNIQNADNEVTIDEEDDEVQFVETRNSPICIESDDDDDINSKDTTETSITSNNNNKNENNKLITTTETTTVTVSKNVTVTRTSARKSTAKPQQNQVQVRNNPNTTAHIENKSKNSNYFPKASIRTKRSLTHTAQYIVDCIELLDSSDEESVPFRINPTPNQKTPQKRTLLAAKGNYYKNNNNKTTSVVPNRLPHNFSPQVRQQTKKPAPPPLPPPTPQSNFLNAVQLQPASVSGPNPPAFSALLSNKSVIIPNAFYGNPPNVRSSPDIELERRYARWLDNFLNQFCKPQFVPTHSCLVFLQRALKYKDFVRIKGLRTNMNSHAQSANNQLNIELMTDLKIIFLKNSKKISNYGRRFCELTCSAVPGKSVALMAHGISGKVTLKTCNMDLPKSTNSALSSASSPSCSGTNSLTRKRQLDEDEDEYTPDKSKFKTSENGDEDSSEMGDDRKRSLRTKRTKRLDNSFSYNEDDLLAEYEIDDEDDEKLAELEMQRKIEQKRLEAEKQRQQQAKSFESAFIQAFARSKDGPTTSSKTSKNASTQRLRLKNTTTATATSIRQYTATNDAEDLLQATWIENHETAETQVISDDDEPKPHRIYKQQQQQQQQQQQAIKLSSIQKYKSSPSPKFGIRASKRNQEEIITGDDDHEENNYYSNNPTTDDPLHWPKNIDCQMYVNGKYKDRCVICNLSCQRLVHHYVNEHRGCEVYNSRLSSSQIKVLKQGKCTVSEVSLYKNGQFQYEAYCIFCQKTSRFMFPYWYQHFTMHTGEYAYRCIGCGIRKPTRSLLTQHQAQGCPEVGGVAQDYAYDSRTLQIDAKICSLCNYVQLHRSNIVKHLHTQHDIKQILPKHIQTIVLIKISASTMAASPSSMSSCAVPARRMSTRQSSSQARSTYIVEEDDADITYEEILPEETQPQICAENNYYNYIPPYMQAAFNAGNYSFEDADGGDDLSYMICGMLDVEMNPEAD